MARDDQHGSTLPRRQLGRALREARQGAGFTLEQAAGEMEMSKTSVIRIEKGHNEKVKLRDVEGFGRLYELTEDQITELKALAQQAATKSWWVSSRHRIKAGFETYLELEPAASKLHIYQSSIVPGLLQTLEYARGIVLPFFPDDTPENVEQRLALRMRRAAILTRQHHPVHAEFLIHESALHIRVGSAATMARQMRYIADMSTRPNISVRVLPFTAGFPGTWAPVHPFIILDFPTNSREFHDEPPVVHTETTMGTMFFESSDDVNIYRGIHETLREATLEEHQSRDLLRQLARRYER
ncbi:helix-turn-helix domain-containing protein [Nocardia carnea]|uniref:helix-turn-helix domain-containing protein n=1 Tax=Nocardia carnea TaxID=37328 RepID=UPI002456E65F|nr:helix-turn-helix transcriptional regulator [Nocardia carnea]